MAACDQWLKFHCITEEVHEVCVLIGLSGTLDDPEQVVIGTVPNPVFVGKGTVRDQTGFHQRFKHCFGFGCFV
ncbi:hypothetical protein MAV3388_09180 [Mycobacterium avium subsp. hominissuis 3388]|nr:hypothetical protein MAV3388_09180 [Mycobacterium avium subsp. hominissuis 3388]